MQDTSLLANIRLGWKSLPGVNTLANYEKSQTTDKKGFIRLGPGQKHAKNIGDPITIIPAQKHSRGTNTLAYSGKE